MEALPGSLVPGSRYTYIPNRNECRQSPLWGYPCSCLRFLWDNFAEDFASGYLDPYTLWSGRERRGYEVYTVHQFECPVGTFWITEISYPTRRYDYLEFDRYLAESEDETPLADAEEQRLEAKWSHELRRDASNFRRIRNRREHVGSHNWYRAWNSMPGPVQSKVSRREREDLKASTARLGTDIVVASPWDGCEDKGKRRTAARPSYWKRRECCCLSCSHLYKTLFESYKRMQKANRKKLIRRYQTASNAKDRNRVTNQREGARRGPSWTDYAWELTKGELDWEDCWSGVEHTDQPLPSPSTQEIHLVQMAQTKKYAKKPAMYLPREFYNEPFRSPALSTLSSDWDAVSIVSDEDFIMV